MYLDTSVIVAYYLPEEKSEKVQNLFTTNSELTISEFGQLEFYSALSIRVRTNSLLETDARRIIDIFNKHLYNSYYLNKSLNSKHYNRAANYIMALNLPLKAPDALHLAFAASQGLKIITIDKQLANNASKLGIDYDLF